MMKYFAGFKYTFFIIFKSFIEDTYISLLVYCEFSLFKSGIMSRLKIKILIFELKIISICFILEISTFMFIFDD